MESLPRIKLKLAKRIKTLREEKGLTSEALAKQAGISKSTLSYIERGLSDPKLSTLVEIARELGIDLKKLFQE